MSYQLTQDAIDLEAGLTASEKSVLIVICRHADDEGRNAYPSTATLSAKSGLYPRTVMAAVRSLEDKGWISSTQEPGKRRLFTVSVSKIRGVLKTAGVPKDAGVLKTAGDPCQKQQGTPAKNSTRIDPIRNPLRDPSSTSTVVDVEAASPDFVLSGDESPAPKKNGIPPCPAQKMVEAFNRRIPPAMPRVLSISPARQQAMSARWRFIWTDCKCLTVEDALDEWDGFLTRVTRSDFLMNRTERKFRGGLDFLVTQRGFLGVIEGKYDNNR